LRSVAAIARRAACRSSDGRGARSRPILVGRNEAKLEALAHRSGINARVSTNLDAVLDDPYNEIYFDAQLTQLRAPA
jgi:predicted dehydrogenase